MRGIAQIALRREKTAPARPATINARAMPVKADNQRDNQHDNQYIPTLHLNGFLPQRGESWDNGCGAFCTSRKCFTAIMRGNSFRSSLMTTLRCLLLAFALTTLAGCGGDSVKPTPPAPVVKPVPPAPPVKIRIGIALGGGAAKGFAHIGVIKMLDPTV